MTTPTPILPELRARATRAAHPTEISCVCGASTLADRPDGAVVRHGDTVAKAHAPGTDPAGLDLRLAVAAHPDLADVLLRPLRPTASPLHDRLVTFWPYGTPVDPDRPEHAPWEAVGTLLARLHSTPTHRLPPALPPMRGPLKAARALSRLRAAAPTHRAAAPILAAWRTLPPWARAEVPYDHARALCHGDLHLGQLVRHPDDPAAWRLIDVDDLGVGDPAWDLARPAAWFACGLLPTEEWTRFLAAYQRTGGAKELGLDDPWPALDVPARALTVQTAALAVTKAVEAGRVLDEVEEAVVDACARMTSVPPQLGPDCAK
ncbi:phosphotransferase [Streptomyces sp. SID8379]|uniref:phosphotransferase family protein n=1 Tax=unclassified Streptomyces TaxID=2593676 RepID=UPI00037E4E29|nr:aminoglycoside phosphotransferase family protein [Streptomyces sp. HmicA12]MYW65072.1 phosphotransferase [Streptomyces sp. SID8379]